LAKYSVGVEQERRNKNGGEERDRKAVRPGTKCTRAKCTRAKCTIREKITRKLKRCFFHRKIKRGVLPKGGTRLFIALKRAWKKDLIKR
jgi:hypothetical protein